MSLLPLSNISTNLGTKFGKNQQKVLGSNSNQVIKGQIDFLSGAFE